MSLLKLCFMVMRLFGGSLMNLLWMSQVLVQVNYFAQLIISNSIEKIEFHQKGNRTDNILLFDLIRKGI